MSRTTSDAPSLRIRLLTLMAAGFCFLLLIISVMLWNYSRTAANKTYDFLLSGAALSILDRVSVTADGATVDLPTAAMDILGLAPRDRLVYSVFVFDGPTLTGTTELPLSNDTLPSAEPAYYDATYQNVAFRFIIQARPVTVSGQRQWVGVRIGQTLEARNAQQMSLFVYGLAGLAGVSLLGLGAVWLAIQTALRPLQDIEEDLARRSPSDLTAMKGHPPQEITSLFGAINSFMARLSASRSLNETFIADVAHQTRTSLSALQGQLALAVDSKDPAEMAVRVAKADAQARRSVRLTNQLLANAMVIHRSDSSNLTPIALTPVVRHLMTDIIKDSASRSASFSFDAEVPEQDDLIMGDAISIREALRNLIDNALRHGPEDNNVDIDLRPDGPDRIVLSVSDAGPGIPEHLRSKATERFVSLSQKAGGSGLGLAIVEAVATSHRGTLTLGQSRKGGLRAAISFPILRVLACLAVLFATALPDRAVAEGRTLTIYSATDTDAIWPLLEAYRARHPGLTLDYHEFLTRELYDTLSAEGAVMPDVVISSAMDLQVDLVNRGLAQGFPFTGIERLPDWAHWRSELVGFTFEPAAIAYNVEEFAGMDMPRTHQDLARFIRANQGRLWGRIGTYDMRNSGIGYLYATQAVVQGLDSQRMSEVLGRANARLFCCTSAMLDLVASGNIAMAVDVIGSYAVATAATEPRLRVTLMEDYNLVMARSAFIPAAAANADEGVQFIEFLISDTGQSIIARETELIPLLPPKGLHTPALDLIAAHDGTFLPIPLRPGLLTYLDQLKMKRFLDGWLDSVQAFP